MGTGRLALLVGASLCVSSLALAQPAGGEIDMDEDPVQPDQPKDQPKEPPKDQAPAEQTPPADQPVVKDPKVAKKWLQAGDTLVKKGDYYTRKNQAADAKQQYDNAVTAYQKAIEASDDVTINYALALAEDKAGNTPDAMKHLKLVATAQNMKPDLVKKSQAKLDELSMKVGLVTLTIKPEGTQVSVDGKQVGEAPMTEPLVLMPGMHKVTLIAVGFQPKDVDLKIEAGSESERKIALEPVPVVNKPQGPEEPEPAPVAQPKGPDMMPIYIGGGATAALVLTATVTGIIAISEHGTYTDPKVSATERADAQSSGRTFAHVTDICLVGAVGAAAFTAYWYQYKYRPQARAFAERQQQAKVDVVPWVQPEAGGLVVAGHF